MHESLIPRIHIPSHSRRPPKRGWSGTYAYRVYMQTPPAHYYLESSGRASDLYGNPPPPLKCTVLVTHECLMRNRPSHNRAATSNSVKMRNFFNGQRQNIFNSCTQIGVKGNSPS